MPTDKVQRVEKKVITSTVTKPELISLRDAKLKEQTKKQKRDTHYGNLTIKKQNAGDEINHLDEEEANNHYIDNPITTKPSPSPYMRSNNNIFSVQSKIKNRPTLANQTKRMKNMTSLIQNHLINNVYP